MIISFKRIGIYSIVCITGPREDKVVTISRAKGSLTFSASFQLIAAMNPCSCGYYGDSLESIRQQMQAARDIQNKRFTNGKVTDIVSNADMRIGEISQFCQLQLSARACHRILKLVRTIVDLAGSEEI